VAIGGLLGLRFLNKRKTNASKTSDLVLLLEPSSPQSKEEDPTPGSNPQPELDPSSQESVVTSSGNQRPASSHDPGLPPGWERNEKVRKFLENGFKNYDEVVILLNAVRVELRWTSKILSQLIHATTVRLFNGYAHPHTDFPFYFDETGPNMLCEGGKAQLMCEFMSTFLSKKKGYIDWLLVAGDILKSLNTKRKRHVFIENLFREHAADDRDYDPISLEPLP
jgi:hypothetical protein